MRKIFFLILFFISQVVFCQTILEANGLNNTYDLINATLSPGYSAIEAPDCSHKEFGNHIDEVFDKELNKYVFRFHIHTTPDNDRCKKFDRQRNEIKTYKQSPDSLLGIQNEKVVYKWKFKLDANFQPSTNFTHIHQLKSIGGVEEKMPLITLTVRKATPDKLELRYAAALSQNSVAKTNLQPFKGNWVEVIETVVYGELGVGKYTISIKKVNDGTVLLEYTNNNIRMWKTDALFIRPKWGIYRSLKDLENLRDEQILFADFSIQEFK